MQTSSMFIFLLLFHKIWKTSFKILIQVVKFRHYLTPWYKKIYSIFRHMQTCSLFIFLLFHEVGRISFKILIQVEKFRHYLTSW